MSALEFIPAASAGQAVLFLLWEDPGLVSNEATNRLIFSDGEILPLTGLIQPFSETGAADFTATDFFRDDDGPDHIARSGFDIYAWLIAEPMRFNANTGFITGRTWTIPTSKSSLTLSWPNVSPEAFPSLQTLR